MSGKQIIAMNRVGWNLYGRDLSRSEILLETSNPAGEGAWFITFRNLRETNNSRNGLCAEAERDKSRPYAHDNKTVGLLHNQTKTVRNLLTDLA